MGVFDIIGDVAATGLELTEQVPGAGTILHGGEALYHTGAEIADEAIGDEVDADEHMAKASINALEAIPMVGSVGGLVHAGVDTAYGFDTVEHAATKRFVQDAFDDGDPAWKEKQGEWDAEEHPQMRANRLPPMPRIPGNNGQGDQGQSVDPGPSLDENGNPVCVE